MKIFVVYAKIELIQKPNWLDAFRAKYDEPFEYHITLKQPCVVENDQVPDIKNKLDDLFLNLKIPNQVIYLVFDSLGIDDTVDGDICIMINATDSSEIHSLQRKILLALSGFNQYLKPKTKEYEENFQPHITIASNLDKQSYSLASKELKRDYICQGIVKEIVLAVVDNANATEASNPKNQTVYIFK